MTNSQEDFSTVPGHRSLEKALLERSLQPTKQESWEREMVRGYVFSFDEYQLSVINSSGQKEKVTIQEDAAMIATRVWDCAVLTSRWVEHISLQEDGIPNLSIAFDLKARATNRPIQVLELGAGTGMLSICLAKIGAAVHSTEYGTVLKHLEDNCRRNGVLLDPSTGQTVISGMVTCRELDWYNASATLESLFSANEDAIFDLIIVTDCSLTDRDSQGVIDMIHKYSTKNHTKVVVGSCCEREGTPFLLKRIQNFQNVRQVQTSELHPNYQSSRHIIMTFDA